MTKNRLIIILFFTIVFAVGLIGIYTIPLNVKQNLNQFVTTQDGMRISYDVFEPAYDNSQNKSAIILGHGIMVNKEVYRLMAMNLAEQGFVVVTFDFRSHGQSGGTLNTTRLPLDILAIKDYLKNRGDINMHDLGYVGYSMGGGAGFDLLSKDNDFNAMVGLAPVPDYQETNSSNPRNLLLIVGKYDEAINFNQLLIVMQNKTGIAANKIELNRIYGSFTNGTAAKLFLENDTDHLGVPYDVNSVKQVQSWMMMALENKSQTPASQNVSAFYLQILFLIISIIGGIVAFFLFFGFIIERFSNKRKVENELPLINFKMSLKKIALIFFPFVLLLSFPSILIGFPLFAIPLAFTDLFIAILIGFSAAVFFYSLYIYKKNGIKIRESYKYELKRSSWKNLIIGIAFGIILYFILKFSVGNFMGILPGNAKFVWMPIYFVVILLTMINFNFFFMPIISEKIGLDNKKNLLKSLGFVFFSFIIILSLMILIPCILLNNYFLALALILAAPIYFLVSSIWIYSYSKRKDIVLSSFTTSIFLTLILVTLSPVMSISSLIFVF